MINSKRTPTCRAEQRPSQPKFSPVKIFLKIFDACSFTKRAGLCSAVLQRPARHQSFAMPNSYNQPANPGLSTNVTTPFQIPTATRYHVLVSSLFSSSLVEYELIRVCLYSFPFPNIQLMEHIVLSLDAL